jgi:hypothetical protein
LPIFPSLCRQAAPLPPAPSAGGQGKCCLSAPATPSSFSKGPIPVTRNASFWNGTKSDGLKAAPCDLENGAKARPTPASGYGLFGRAADASTGQRQMESKSRPKRDNAPLMAAVKGAFKKDRSPDQRAGRLRVEYPQRAEMRRIRSIRCPPRRFTDFYGELTEEPEMKGHFRHPHACRKVR